jgi:hypothetical protein
MAPTTQEGARHEEFSKKTRNLAHGPGSRPLPETNSISTALILDFQPPELNNEYTYLNKQIPVVSKLQEGASGGDGCA